MNRFFAFILLFIMAGCSLKNKDSGDDGINACYEELRLLRNLQKECGYDAFEEGSFCFLFEEYGVLPDDENQIESYRSCKNNITDLSCEQIVDITVENVITELRSIGCFDLNRRLKSDVCAINQMEYCFDIFHECGKESWPAICEGAAYDDSNSEHGFSFNKEVFKQYCEDMQYGAEEADLDDFFCGFSFLEGFNCESPPDINFKNDEWKKLCSEPEHSSYEG